MIAMLTLAGCDPPTRGLDGESVLLVTDLMRGSGLLLDDDTILTANHVGSTSGLVASGPTVPGQVATVQAYHDADLDLSLLTTVTPAPRTERVQVSCAALRPGERLTAVVSSPGMSDHMINPLVVSSPVGDTEVLVSGTILQGMSGGPVFDEYGRLVGVVTKNYSIDAMTLMGPRNVPVGFGVIVGPQALCRFLDDAGYDMTGGAIVRVG